MKFEKIVKIAFFFNDEKNKDLDIEQLTIQYRLAPTEYELLDRELYVRKYDKIEGYTKKDKIELTLGKVKFLFEEKVD